LCQESLKNNYMFEQYFRCRFYNDVGIK